MTNFTIKYELFNQYCEKIFKGLNERNTWRKRMMMWWSIASLADSEIYDCKEEADEIFAAIQSWRNQNRDPDW